MDARKGATIAPGGKASDSSLANIAQKVQAATMNDKNKDSALSGTVMSSVISRGDQGESKSDEDDDLQRAATITVRPGQLEVIIANVSKTNTEPLEGEN